MCYLIQCKQGQFKNCQYAWWKQSSKKKKMVKYPKCLHHLSRTLVLASSCLSLLFPSAFCIPLGVVSSSSSSSHLENSLLPYSHQPNTFIIFSATSEKIMNSVLSLKLTKHKSDPTPWKTERAKSLRTAAREGGLNICLLQRRRC